VTVIFCLGYFIGNLAIPGAVLTGQLQPRATSVAVTASPQP
jgi:hypothetical protein